MIKRIEKTLQKFDQKFKRELKRIERIFFEFDSMSQSRRVLQKNHQVSPQLVKEMKSCSVKK